MFQSALSQGHNQINKFGMMVESFSRFSRLLDANFDAMHGSFASVLRLMDVFGEFVYIIKTFAIFRILFGTVHRVWKSINSLAGRNLIQSSGGSHSSSSSSNKNLSNDLKDFTQFTGSTNTFNMNNNNNARGISYALFIFGLTCISAPMILFRIWNILKRRQVQRQQNLLDNNNNNNSISFDTNELQNNNNTNTNININSIDNNNNNNPQHQPNLLENAWKGDQDQDLDNDKAPVMVRALYDFHGETETDLPFRKNDLIRLLDKPYPQWWFGELAGRRGMFPVTHVQLIDKPIADN